MSGDVRDTLDELRARDQLTRTLLCLIVDQVKMPTLAVGRVPDGWPESLTPPPPAVVVGGVKAGQGIMAVFGYPPETAGPVAEYRAFLERDGWTPSEDLMKGGFHDSVVATLHRGSSMVHVRSAASGPADDGSIIVSVVPYEESPAWSAMRRFRFETIDIPRLESPPGVRFDGGGGGGSGDHTHRHVRITTDLTPAELLPLYSAQLADAGWTMGELNVSPAAATQWVEAPDPKGRTCRGLLTVYVNGPGREVFIYMARTPE
jgi:hypothetical protein